MKTHAQVNTDGKSLEKMELLAETGDAEAQYQLAMMHFHGEQTQQDHEEAFRLGMLAARQDHAPAQALLGFAYFNGLGVARDKGRSFEWYCRSAESGYPAAQYSLANIYASGKVVAKDIEEALHWYTQAADQDDIDSLCELGRRYYHGTGVEQDRQKAFACYLRAAQLEDAFAQALVGWLFLEGRGVDADYFEAEAWLERAAAQGEDSAVGLLAELDEFILVTQELDEALGEHCPYWFKLRRKTVQKILIHKELFIESILQDLHDIARIHPYLGLLYDQIATWILQVADTGEGGNPEDGYSLKPAISRSHSQH